MPDDWLAFLGVNTRDLIGGISGGFVASLLDKRPQFLHVCAKTIVGGFTAVFVSHSVQGFLGPFAEAAPYFIGLAGYGICHAAIKTSSMWAPIGGKKDDE